MSSEGRKLLLNHRWGFYHFFVDVIPILTLGSLILVPSTLSIFKAAREQHLFWFFFILKFLYVFIFSSVCFTSSNCNTRRGRVETFSCTSWKSRKQLDFLLFCWNDSWLWNSSHPPRLAVKSSASECEAGKCLICCWFIFLLYSRSSRFVLRVIFFHQTKSAM